MAQDTPSRKLDQYIVRFPDGMRDRLKVAAAENNRSLNAEIVARLEQSFDPLIAEVHGGRDMLDVLAEMSERIVRKIREEERKEGLAPLPYDPKDAD
ncbi:MAG: Arc family DNA-binding protein [Shinella sp.]|uniref:Arc family DNA-binding protein n=1 Tax=Shinella sp. TaxID=1870904 RepID=UPI003C7932E3